MTVFEPFRINEQINCFFVTKLFILNKILNKKKILNGTQKK